MKILVINCGSSTLKFQVIELDEATPLGRERRLGHGLVDRIGRRGEIKFVAENGERFQETVEIADHGMAARRVFEWLKSLGLMGQDGIEAVGHRMVHGGHRFIEPTPVDDRVIDAIETMRYLAPLHNEPSLKATHAARATLGATLPMVAVFDTAFHAGMPRHSSRYAILHELAVKHHIRRYGFHGLAHRYMTERYGWMKEKALEQVKLVTLQLGNGCSAAAIDKGRSVDTSMGFTPLEGLMMGTRSGDVDPNLPGFLVQREGVDIDQVESWLNTKSGLLGVSGLSQDMRELLRAESQGDEKAALAVEMFCYRVKKQIGAYLAALGGAGAVIFGGGIGENSPAVRARICAGMEWCGMAIDENRNNTLTGIEGKISTDDAKVEIYVIPVDEAVMIARDTVDCLRKHHLGRKTQV
jgi:acetate kinase